MATIGERGSNPSRESGPPLRGEHRPAPVPGVLSARRELPFDDVQAPLYSVGQVADMLGVQPAFLRRLDNEEVVRPSRSEGGQRRYSQQQIFAVERVVVFAGSGMNLAGIRHILELEGRVRELEAELDAERRRQTARRRQSAPAPGAGPARSGGSARSSRRAGRAGDHDERESRTAE